MGAWFHRVWADEESFKALLRAGFKYVASLLGAAVATGVITPPGIGDQGWRVGLFVLAVSLSTPTSPLDPAKRGPAQPTTEVAVPPPTPPIA